MNGKEVFRGLSYIGRDLIEEAEYGAFPRRNVWHGVKRTAFLAAVIGLLLLLVGCTVVYVIHLQDLQVGNQQTQKIKFDRETGFLGYEAVPEQALTLAGVKGSAEYTAAKEWFDFLQSYDPNREIYLQLSKEKAIPKFDEAYAAYESYTQEMVDQLDALCQKYNLKLLGKRMEFRSMKEFLRAVGLQSVLIKGSHAAALYDDLLCYCGGSFKMGLDICIPEEYGNWPHPIGAELIYNRKGYLNTSFALLSEETAWEEWRYVTAAGAEILIFRGAGDSYAYFFSANEEATLTVVIGCSGIEDGKTVFMSNNQLEKIADTIDFSMYPTLPNLNAAQAPANTSLWEISFHSAQTDGVGGKIIFDMTAPGISAFLREGYSLAPANWMQTMLTSSDPSFEPAYLGVQIIDNGDDLEQTAWLIIEFDCNMGGDSAFWPNVQWNVFFEDMIAGHWNGPEYIRETVEEGVWELSFSFPEREIEKLEFLKEPITIDAVIGMMPNGQDLYGRAEIREIVLRENTAVLLFTDQYSAVSIDYVQAVYCDGETMELELRGVMPGVTYFKTDKNIDLGQVACLRLPDGTELEAIRD